MAKKHTKPNTIKNIIFSIIAIILLAIILVMGFAFGSYKLNRFPITKYYVQNEITAIPEDQWKTYKNPSGWELKYHPYMKFTRTYTVAGDAYFTQKKVDRVSFVEVSKDGKENGHWYEVTVIPNPKRIPLKQFINEWKKSERVERYTTVEENRIKAGKYYGNDIFVGNYIGKLSKQDYESGMYTIFLDVRDDVVLLGQTANIFTGDRYDYAYPETLLRLMMRTIILPNEI